MKPFQRAFVPPEQVRRIREDMVARGHTRDEVEKAIEQSTGGMIFRNDKYQVLLQEADVRGRRGIWPRMAMLSIKRIDRGHEFDWRELQEIKNQLIGPEHEAVELFPSEERLVDSANQRFLWVAIDETFRFPFGFTERMVSEDSVAGSVQRPFDKPPEGAPEPCQTP